MLLGAGSDTVGVGAGFGPGLDEVGGASKAPREGRAALTCSLISTYERTVTLEQLCVNGLSNQWHCVRWLTAAFRLWFGGADHGAERANPWAL